MRKNNHKTMDVDRASTTYTRPFRVRWQECDATGVVNTINYLYYMQETALAHSVELGYTTDRWLDKGIAWVIRETEIEYFNPLKYGDSIEISMRMGDLRRTSATRFFELILVGESKHVAKARSEWVAIDIDTLRPLTIPKDVIADFFTYPAVDKPSPRKRFPKGPSPPMKLFRSFKTVEWRDLDLQRHVNNATYLSYMETASLEAVEKVGLSFQSVLEQNIGAVQQWSHVLYQGQAAVSDELEITTYVSEVGTTSYIAHYMITRQGDGAILTRGHTRWVWIDLATQKPRPIPTMLRAGLDEYTAHTEVT
jgi:acyl-CoA thioester hydrolase